MAVKKPTSARKQRLPEPEELFYDYVKRMARHREGRECIIVHMSRLEVTHRARHHIELVVTRLGQFARMYEGQLFAFVNGDVAVVVHDAPTSETDNVLFDIRFNFSEDPLVQAEDAGVQEEDKDKAVFIEQFDVHWDYDEVAKAAKDRREKFLTALEHQDAPKTSDKDGNVEEAAPVPVKTHLKAVPPEKTASLLDMDRQKDRSRDQRRSDHEGRRSQSSGVAGPIDRWLADNRVCVGGTYLPLGTFLRKVPVYELGRGNKVPAAISLLVDEVALFEAYTRAVGMKMNGKLERYLVEEVETGVLPLLRSLTSPVRSSSLHFGMSLQFSAETILSPAFLLAARQWQELEEDAVLFWFTPDDLKQNFSHVAYVSEFLRDLHYFVGVRGVEPCDMREVEDLLPGVEFWGLRWPEEDLAQAAQSDVRGLEYAISEFGAGRVFLQQIDRIEKSKAARAFGFQFAESQSLASEKLFTR